MDLIHKAPRYPNGKAFHNVCTLLMEAAMHGGQPAGAGSGSVFQPLDLFNGHYAL